MSVMGILQYLPVEIFERLKEILHGKASSIDPGMWQPLKSCLFIHSSPL